MSHAFQRLAISVAALALLASSAVAASAATVVDPALRFQTLTTPHFTIYFHDGEGPAARRLAAIAEETRGALTAAFGSQLPSHTHVVLVDQSELANGSATPVPYDTIVITATWPAGYEFIGLTDDWLRLVFTHEYTHILHLDRSSGWARVARELFGRIPIAFPNLFLPVWQVEGLAVYEESRLGEGDGRLHAGDFRAIVDTDRRERSLEPLDRVNGGLTDWPGGNGPYAYGAAFHEFLAERYGVETLGALADATSRSIPYTGSLAFRRVYGKSLGELWQQFEQAQAESAPPDSSTRVTRHGFSVTSPRFIPSCAGCAPDIVYALRTPDAFPTLNAVSQDGSHDRVLAERYLGTTTAGDARAVVFDQLEIRRNVALYSDLYLLDRSSGEVRALTRDARLRDPDLSPDGRRIVCVREHDGQRDLVVAEFVEASGRRELRVPPVPLVGEADTQFDAPRWSPDGKSIAVTRHRLGEQSQLVIVDASSATVRVLASDNRTRFVTPAWRPDGLAVVAAADFDEGVFNLYEFDVNAVDPPRQITRAAGGATWPDVSPDGTSIAYVGYTKDGFDIFTVPYPRGNAAGATPAGSRPAAAGDHASNRDSFDGQALPYSPWRTLRPTSWMPFVDAQSDQTRIGAAVSGSDVLGYHAYALSATWLAVAKSDAAAPPRATPDWQVAYAYERRRPIFFVSAERDTSFFAGPPTESGLPTNVTAREYQIEGGVQVPFVHARAFHVVFASFLRSDVTYAFADGPLGVTRSAVRLGWESSTAHVFGYSISPERGVAAGATFESVPRALGSSDTAKVATVDARLYAPGLADHHVLAVRVAGGRSDGSDIVGRTFLAGGGGPAPAPLSYDSRALGLLRGFPADTFAGSRVLTSNVDYRFPLGYPQRGHGTFPLFLKSVHAAIVADASNTWTQSFRAQNTAASIGGEIAGDFVAGYGLPFTAALGAAWGHDGAHRVADTTTIYLRIGRAF